MIWGDSCGSGDIDGSWWVLHRGVQLTLVDANIDIQKSNVGGGSGPGKVDNIATVETFKENSEGLRICHWINLTIGCIY